MWRCSGDMSHYPRDSGTFLIFIVFCILPGCIPHEYTPFVVYSIYTRNCTVFIHPFASRAHVNLILSSYLVAVILRTTRSTYSTLADLLSILVLSDCFALLEKVPHIVNSTFWPMWYMRMGGNGRRSSSKVETQFVLHYLARGSWCKLWCRAFTRRRH
jgi:hypothetical protein